MFKSYHAIVIFVLIALLGLVGFIAPTMAEEPNAANISELEATCDSLTDNDEDGRIFKAFRGKLYRRTGQITNFGFEGTTRKCMITLENNGQYMPFENTLLQDKNCEKLASFLNQNPELFKESRYSKDDYGLCATITDDNTYIYEIDTLTIIRSR